MKPRILVIRGGAIGDFILTLPALGLLRDAFPNAHLEIIGYRHIVALAEGRHYANAARSIEFGPLAGFFARNGTLNDELHEYFASFQQVVSYLFDPDGIFEANLKRCGVKNFLNAHVKVDDSAHAAEQLARPLQRLALFLEESAARFHPTEADRTAAAEFIAGGNARFIAVHPGSGSPRKNWPFSRWKELIARLAEENPDLGILVAGGEADYAILDAVKGVFGERVRFARDLPLPLLGAVLGQSVGFIGHDSGISHLAAAAGARCLLLFGPTDPAIWAPANAGVRTLRKPSGDLEEFSVSDVLAAWAQLTA